MLNIESNDSVKPFALFNLGFRPFFLAAAGFAAIAMLLWMGSYVFGWSLQPYGAAQIWHAHEMVFGFSLAVIAGFLLTAVKNWTHIQTPYGLPLMIILLLWLVGRVLPFISGIDISTVAVVDNLFIVSLIAGVGYPIIKSRQWQQAFILILLVLFLVANLVFYAGLLGMVENGMRIGLYSGLYLVLGMILLMGRRVIPFFIEKGVDESVQLTNHKWLDVGSPVIFIAFWYADVILSAPVPSAAIAGVLFILHTLRLHGWHTPGIWQKSLLWSIYLAYAFLALGFALHALAPLLGLSPYIALHAFSVGGIGLMTLGMMARVALGHTGRNVFAPPGFVAVIFIIISISAVVRILMPAVMPSEYVLWIALAQFLWIVAFAAFFLFYLPILWRPRIDGRFG
jgi:uncharacterized protein involved in response to NO